MCHKEKSYNGFYHFISTWNTRGVLVGYFEMKLRNLKMLLKTSSMRYLKAIETGHVI